MFVLDSSSSVGANNWKLQLKFLTDIVNRLDIGSGAVRVAMVTFNTHATIEFSFGNHTSKAALISAIHNVKYFGGATATGDALALAWKLFFNTIFAKPRAGVPKIVILITDGRTDTGVDQMKEAARLKASGATLITVGISSGVDK